jgi:DNA-binding CsgD family transcriptional regulator
MKRKTTLEKHHSLYAAISEGGSGRAVANVLFQTAAAFDFSAVTLFVMPSKTDRALASLVLETSLSPEFWQRMDELSPLANCALFNAARGSIVPVQWSADKLRRQDELMNKGDTPALALYEEFRLTHGIVFPVSSIDGVRHAMRFDGSREPLTQAEINDLAMLATHFFQAYDKARYPLGDDPCGLTERELEVIRWSSTGKTSSEIAAIMSLSDHTINAYLNNAFRKTNSVNRTQLVAKALRMRIIS